MDFYDKLLSYKAVNKLSWSDIGSVINKEQATMRIAVNRKSLSELEIRELEKKFFSVINYENENAINKVSEPNESYPGNIHKLAYESILFFDELMTVEQYKNFFNNKLDLELDKFKDLEALKKYINR